MRCLTILFLQKSVITVSVQTSNCANRSVFFLGLFQYMPFNRNIVHLMLNGYHVSVLLTMVIGLISFSFKSVVFSNVYPCPFNVCLMLLHGLFNYVVFNCVSVVL